MHPFYLAATSGLVIFFVLRVIIRRIKLHSIAHLPGPNNKVAWLVGHMPEIARPKEMGDADIYWTREHGSAICIKGMFGENLLFLSDPKALQYIFNTAGYNFPKPDAARSSTQLVTGRGIIWAEGSQHSRQRKIMNPAFSFPALRGFLPLFTYTSRRMIAKLKEEVRSIGKTPVVIDILPWLARTTLDAIGAAGFDYQFGAIDQGSENKLSQAYSNLFADAFLERPDSMMVLESLVGMLPQWMGTLMLLIPNPRLERLHTYMRLARDVAKEVVDRQTASYLNNKEGSKDIMSILVHANMAENPTQRLSEDEVLAQLTTIFVAGHETTASTITWALYELARHPEYQTRVREEIKAVRVQAAQRDDTELTIADLDSMKCLLALMKETLRFHPIVPQLSRVARRDDVIPLSTPVKTKTGDLITGIPISAGQHVFLSFVAYNRLKSVWGEDAEQWRPDRFLEGIGATQSTSLGVFANIITFSSGIRGCIGWRFAVLEMQAILIELLENFEFSPPPGNIEIIRAAAGLMAPMVKGSTGKRAELPITITPV